MWKKIKNQKFPFFSFFKNPEFWYGRAKIPVKKNYTLGCEKNTLCRNLMPADINVVLNWKTILKDSDNFDIKKYYWKSEIGTLRSTKDLLR